MIIKLLIFYRGFVNFLLDTNKLTKKVSLRGVGILQWQGLRPYKAATKWTMGWFDSPTLQAICLQMQTTKKTNGINVNIGFVVKDGNLLLCNLNNHLNIKEECGTLQIIGIDNSENPNSISIEEIKMSKATNIKVLDNLPYILRKVLQVFMNNPSISHFHKTNCQAIIGNGEKFKGTFLIEESIIQKDS